MAGPPSTNYLTGRPCTTHPTNTRRAQAWGTPYWKNLTQSGGTIYYDLDDAPTATTGGDSGLVSGGSWFYEHLTASDRGQYRIKNNSSIGRAGDAPLGGTTSLSLTNIGVYPSWNLSGNSNFFLPTDTSGGVSVAYIVWTKFLSTTFAAPYQVVQTGGAIDLHGNNPVAWITAFNVGAVHVYTADGGMTLHIVDTVNGYNHQQVTGPGPGRWFMTALIWQPIIDATHGTLEWYRGYQGIGGLGLMQSFTNVSSPVDGQVSGFGQANGTRGGGASGISGWACYPGGFTAEWCAFGAWQTQQADTIRAALNAHSDGADNAADVFCPSH